MSSAALLAFLAALDEVSHLGNASHPTLGADAPESLGLARAVGRGQIVLLSSHFERYIYALNEEVVALLNAAHMRGDQVPATVRLLHSTIPIDDISRTGWEHREGKLRAFVAEDGWLWSPGVVGSLSHDRLLTWMKAPGPESLLRYFRGWGIQDIFSTVARRQNTRAALWLGVRGLVELRNNIAHGDFSAQATQADVKRYMSYARQFCERADRRLATHISRNFDIQVPWY